MSRKFLVCLCLAALAVSSASLIGQEVKSPQNDQLAGYTGPLTRALDEPIQTGQAGNRQGNRNTPVTIVYDDGIVTAVPTATSFCYGNQFNTASGELVKSFSVTQLNFYMMSGAGTDNVFVSVFGPVSGTTAPFLTSASVPLNNGPGTFNTATVGPATGSGSFLAGVWYTGGDTVGLGSGTNGHGHHGMVINDIVGTGFTLLPSLNALVGASTAFIPVELMDFAVTDE